MHDRPLAIGGVCLNFEDPKVSQLIGTAFAVTARIALTAFHCVGDKDTGRVAHEKLQIWFYDRFVKAKVADSAHALDIAILELEEDLHDGIDPVSLVTRAETQADFISIGWPSSRAFRAHFFTISGSVVNPNSIIFEGVPAIQLHCVQSSTLPLQGYSGAPLLVPTSNGTHAAAGVIRWNPPLTDNPELAAGGTLYASPISELLREKPLLDISATDTVAEQRRAGYCICYAKADAGIARWLGSFLEGRGLLVKARYNYLRAGDNYIKAITEAHTAHPDIIVLVSERTMSCDSPSHQAEVRLLQRRQNIARIIPIRIMPVDLPDFLHDLEPLDLYDVDGEERKKILLAQALDPASPEPSPTYPFDRLDSQKSIGLSLSRLPRVTLDSTGMIEGGP
ncbi:TIR domain-containing protein [Micromonospora wenchangensis]|uniref:TIR domain-containing protein n=1 Tax=Micromonospora wenchangensis TaxID=1185415 RepID=UPI00341A0C3F